MSEWRETLLGADPKTPKQIITEQRRTISRSALELERYKYKEEQRQVRIIADIRKAARKNDYDNAALGAHSLVQSRKVALKLGKMAAHLKSLESRFSMMNASNSLSVAVSGVVKALSAMKNAMSPDDMQRLLREFDEQQKQLDQRQKSMEAALDAASTDAADTQEEREVVKQIFAEIGLETGAAFLSIPAIPSGIVSGVDSAPSVSAQKIVVDDGPGPPPPPPSPPPPSEVPPPSSEAAPPPPLSEAPDSIEKSLWERLEAIRAK